MLLNINTNYKMTNNINQVKKELLSYSNFELMKSIVDLNKAFRHHEEAVKCYHEAALYHQSGNHSDADKSSRQAFEHYYLASHPQKAHMQYPSVMAA